MKWISIKDKLPTSGKEVLTYPFTKISFYVESTLSWWNSTDEFPEDNPTHWMILPKPPKE